MDKDAAGDKPHINLVVLGHTGSGKSTIMGRLLEKLGDVSEDKMAAAERESAEAGHSDMKYAWLVNNTRGERERGLTIDVHAGKFETSNYHVNIMDVPGHRDFIKNMISGTSEADCALLLVSAARGEYKRSLKDDGSGMVPEHALLAFTLGVNQIFVGVNKMDHKTVEHSQERFEKVKNRVQKHLGKIGYKLEEVPFIPISGLNSDNVLESSSKMPWYDGSNVIRNSGKVKVKTLSEALDAMVVPVIRGIGKKSLRLPIRDLYRINGLPVAVGRIECGQLNQGSRLLFGPSPGNGTVLSIQKDHVDVESAGPRDVVGFMVETDSSNANKRRGGMFRRGQICTTTDGEPLKIVKEFIAQIVILEHPKGFITEGYAPIIDIHTSHVQCQIRHFLQKVNRTTGKTVANNPKQLAVGDAANVRMVPMRPMCAEVFRRYPKLGRFSMRDLSRVVGVGVITQITDSETVKDEVSGSAEHAVVERPEVVIHHVSDTPHPPPIIKSDVEVSLRKHRIAFRHT